MFQANITIDTTNAVNTDNDIVFEIRFSPDSPQVEDKLCEKFTDDVVNPLRKLVHNLTTSGAEKILQIRITNV